MRARSGATACPSARRATSAVLPRERARGSAKLLKSHDAPKDRLSRLIERAFGWVFGPFNRFFKASSDRYQGSVSRILRRRGVVFAVYVVLLAGTAFMFNSLPRGLIPTPHKL